MKKGRELFIIAICAVALAAVCTGCTIAVNSGKGLQGSTVNAETNEVDSEKPDSSIVSGAAGTVSGTAASTVSGTAAQKRRYTDDELLDAARNYYSALHDHTPRYCDIDHEEGDKVTIHLYDMGRDFSLTCAWYTVNIYTGKGVDDIFGDKIDIMNPDIEKENGDCRSVN